MGIFLPLVVAAAVQTTASIVGNARKAKIAKQNTNLTIAENKRLAELSYKREQENIGKLLKYNEPLEQMKRFESAGLNRNLIYTQGNPGNQSVFAKYNPPNVEYRYESGFDADSIKPLTGLPLAAQQFKNLVSQGKILKAEALINKALSEFATENAVAITNTNINRSYLSLIEKIWSDQEMKLMFYKSDDNLWRIRPEQVDTFIEMIVKKWFTPVAKYEQTQAEINYKKQQLELLEGALPWLSPLINFLRLIK